MKGGSRDQLLRPLLVRRRPLIPFHLRFASYGGKSIFSPTNYLHSEGFWLYILPYSTPVCRGLCRPLPNQENLDRKWCFWVQPGSWIWTLPALLLTTAVCAYDGTTRTAQGIVRLNLQVTVNSIPCSGYTLKCCVNDLGSTPTWLWHPHIISVSSFPWTDDVSTLIATPSTQASFNPSSRSTTILLFFMIFDLCFRGKG